MEQHQDKISFPLERLPVLIGEKGSTKINLQHVGRIKLDIDSKTGEVTVTAKNSTRLWQATRMLEALASGFPPETARKLFKQGYDYQLVDLKDFARKKDDIPRIKSRLIGRGGAAKRKLQASAQVWLNIGDKQVGIIGETQKVEIAREAINLLASGTSHLRAFLFIEEQQTREGQQ